MSHRQPRVSQLASALLVAVVAGLSGTAGWAAVSVEHSSARVRDATRSLVALDGVQRAVANEAFAEAAYRRSPGPEARLGVENAVGAVASSVQNAQAVANRAEAVMLSHLQLVNDRYAREVRATLDAPADSDDDRVAGPAIVAVQDLIDGATAARTAEVTKAVARQRAVAARVKLVVPAVFGAGLLLLVGCWALMLRRQTRLAAQARAGEQSRRAAHELERARDVAVAQADAVSRFLATMSHEIRTPMNAVLGAAGLLQDTSLDPAQRELVTILRSSGDGLLQIINDVLDYSKIEAGELQIEHRAFDLAGIVDDVVSTAAAAAAAKDIDLVVIPDGPLAAAAVGDGGRVRQILVNLVGNAVKFTDSGSVVVRVGVWPGNDVASGSLRINVTDTGIGISSAAVADLFTPFRQLDASSSRAHGGTGLGLAICGRLADAMGGSISVTSTVGSGSVFEVSVPVGLADSPVAMPFEGRTALVLDRPGPRREGLAAQLRALGMRCVSAEFLDSVPAVDVVLHDPACRVPAGSGIPVVAVTAFGESSGEVNVSRPVRTSALVHTLAAVFGVETAVTVPAGPCPGTGNLRILMAEDNPVNRRVGSLLLAALGCPPPDLVENGAAALEAVASRPYDLVLMDVQMPEMDGLETTRRIRELRLPHAQPRIVALTAGALATERTACAAAGMDGYLAKPVQIDALREVLSGAVSSRAASARLPAQGGRAVASGIDTAALDELLGAMGGEGARAELVDAFRTDTELRLGVLAAHCAAGDRRGAAAVAHELKSTASMFGAVRLAELVAELERIARGDADLGVTWEAVEAEYAVVRVSLELALVAGG